MMFLIKIILKETTKEEIMEGTKEKKRRRMRGDCRGCILKATITNGERERPGQIIDYRRIFADYLKKQNLLGYACNYYSEGDPRILWYVQGTNEKLQMAIYEGQGYNIIKRVGEKNIFKYATKKYNEVYLAKIPYDPNYSNCDFTTFMATVPETYGNLREQRDEEIQDGDDGVVAETDKETEQ